MSLNIFDYENELNACAAGDSTALTSLYQHESPAMYALLLAMLGDADIAQEILHDVFILIWRNASGYNPEIGTARAWIYSILRYRALSWQHYNKTTDDIDLPELHSPKPHNNPLFQLTEPQTQALLQAYLHGGTSSDIAARFNRSEPDITTTIETSLEYINLAIKA